MRFVVFLRAVNVGGTGVLPMAALRSACIRAGFEDARTYLASGNLLLTSDQDRRLLQARLADLIATVAGAPVGLSLRTAMEVAALRDQNPFPDAPPERTVAILLERTPTASQLAAAVGMRDEQVRPGPRSVYVWYPSGQGRSRLRIPAAAEGTARNLRTIAALAELAASPDR